MASFIKFIIAGILSAASQFATLILLVEWMHLNPTLSSAISFTISCLVNYLLLYYWAFKSNGKHHVVAFKFILVTLFTLCLNVALFWILTVPLGLWYLFSQVIATGSVVMFNYVFKKNYIF